MTVFTLRTCSLPLTCAVLLCACSAPQDNSAAGKSVAVTTVMPVRKVFHDHVDAWGHATADPHDMRTLSLPYAAHVTAVDIAAGQAVGRGEPLLTVAPDPTARRAWIQARDALTLAQQNLDHTRRLFKQHLATQAQVNAANKALKDAQAGVQSARALGGSKASTTLKAPADGVVMMLKVTRGEQVSAGSPLLVFMPSHAMIARVGVPPQETTTLRKGQAVQLMPVYGAHAAWAGTLTMVGQAVDATTHLVPAQIAVASSSAHLTAGTLLHTRIATSNRSAWAVPRAAVQNDAKGHYLFQLDHGHARRVAVTVRFPAGKTVGVSGDVEAALPVIVQGAYELDDGMAVRKANAAR